MRGLRDGETIEMLSEAPRWMRVLVGDPVAPIVYERVVAADVGMASKSVLTAYYSCQTGASTVVPPHLCIVTTQSFYRAGA